MRALLEVVVIGAGRRGWRQAGFSAPPAWNTWSSNDDWSRVKIDVLDERGRPRHRAGIADRDGVYFLGMPWLAKRKSGILYGVSEDAARIVRHITRHRPRHERR